MFFGGEAVLHAWLSVHFGCESQSDSWVQTHYKIKQLCCIMLDRFWMQMSRNLSSRRCKDIYESWRTKAFCLVNKIVLAQWQTKFAFLKACWMCVIMVWGTVGLLSHSYPPFATTTSSSDLCPLPHLNLQGHKVEMPRPSMVISLKLLYPFHISDLFLKWKKNWVRLPAPLLRRDFCNLSGKECETFLGRLGRVNDARQANQGISHNNWHRWGSNLSTLQSWFKRCTNLATPQESCLIYIMIFQHKLTTIQSIQLAKIAK